MFTRHVSERLSRYCDGDLAPADTVVVEAHLAKCRRCRGELEEIRFAARLVRQLAVVPAPAAVWHGIDGALDETPAARWQVPVVKWACAAVLLLAAIGAATYWWSGAEAAWEVATNGTNRRLAAGQWVETGPDVRARISVGEIGTVDVEPSSRVRLGESGSSGYRLALARGTISAQIVAPPRLFIVDTPVGSVVDLGCAYTMTVDDDGRGVLRMTEGWTALEWKGRESLVPAGAMCRTRPGSGPGMPYFEDATDTLKAAADAFDTGELSAIDIILRDARVRDTLTLWHLLSRVAPGQRARVYDRILELVPPPPNVSREAVLALDADALGRLREELAWHW